MDSAITQASWFINAGPVERASSRFWERDRTGSPRTSGADGP